jgi:isoamylase
MQYRKWSTRSNGDGVGSCAAGSRVLRWAVMFAPDVLPGRNHPLGATVYPHGVSFNIFSRSSTEAALLLFDDAQAPLPSRVIKLDPVVNRTFHFWHVFLAGLKEGQHYAWRMHGPYDPAHGHRFDGGKVLIDPYATCVDFGPGYDRDAARVRGDNVTCAPRSVVVDRRGYDWKGDEPLRRPYSRSVIYELHVGGFTRHESSGVAPERRGTYAGLIDKIPYLQSLGITAVELMPVQQFDPADAPPGLTNYWGYCPLALFAPHRGYSSRKDPVGPVHEFREMVRALHQAGIEVIVDVVFNHTTEGDERGPTLSLRGLENADYYSLLPKDPSRYQNYSGCGNTLNANRAIVRRLILDCLRWWVADMHVDGFRFDLASTFARGDDGEVLSNPPLLWDIEADPILAGTKIIAEAWDAAGLYQVGSFVGHRWAEWNGRYRDDVRRFLKGDAGVAWACAQRIAGSRDLYPRLNRDPSRSINFVTCHDGFTLRDLVSYERKHNERNGEENRDGIGQNDSWNCGVEGPTQDPLVNALRLRQMKNHFAVLLLSAGTPMLSMGDEVGRTQQGNNNAYCHDDPLAWLDWRAVQEQPGLLRFVSGLVRFSVRSKLLNYDRFWSEPRGAAPPALSWHGVALGNPDFSQGSHSLAWELRSLDGAEHYWAAVNAWREPLRFQLPRPQLGHVWRRVVDTAQESPLDFRELPEAPVEGGLECEVRERSVVLLVEAPLATRAG